MTYVTKTLTPSDITTRIQWILEALPDLQDLWVEGEISNLKQYHKGNQLYFNLCDKTSQINCVVFSNTQQQLKFKPENGLLIRAKCKLKVFHKRGTFNLQIAYMTPIQKGPLSQQLDALKHKLQQEGLFNSEKKQAIPKYTTHIGLITAVNSAAQHDICQLLSKNAPHIRISIYPSIMQGLNAAPSLHTALHYFSTSTTINCIIIARGGGSTEDLACFNDEHIVRCIAKLNHPVITAIGHETDYTLCDFVADHRCETPSAAAALIYQPYHQLKQTLTHLLTAMTHAITRKQTATHHTLTHYLATLNTAITQKYTQNQTHLLAQFKTLKTLNPIRILEKGYSHCQTSTGDHLKSIHQVNLDDPITIQVKDGKLTATVTNKESL
jgi:exodeoxyribonuclease VII large subunit